MNDTYSLSDPHQLSETLFQLLPQINPVIMDLELYEFRYALENITPPQGWNSVLLENPTDLENLIRSRSFYEHIHLTPSQAGKIGVDPVITHLTQMLLVGLASGSYSVAWVKQFFYLDIRSFLFFVRTQYFTQKIYDHFGGKPWKKFRPLQSQFERVPDIGYKAFQDANREIDQAFILAMTKLTSVINRPAVFTLAGPTAAGKTEIVERLRLVFEKNGVSFTTVEMDHFYKDRDFRDQIRSHKDRIHFNLFQKAMKQILSGEIATIPRYDFYKAISSHDFEGKLRPGAVGNVIHPADVVFLEGNFPFHISEIAPLIGIKIVYLTDDPIRLKRKWKRDIDYRKKYDVNNFCNRFFRTQFLRAEEIYCPMMAVCDLVVDTTNASIWATPAAARLLDSPSPKE